MEIGLSKAVGIIGLFVALLAVTAIIPIALQQFTNVTSGMASLPLGNITSMIAGLLVGFVIAFGLVKLVADAFGVEIKF
jgi:uncharacterized membrane protein